MKKSDSNKSFIFNVLTLVSGTALSQGITLAMMPVLTRIYSPEQFGIYSLYLAIVSTISVVSSWKYELAIMLPKKEEDAQALLFLSSIITIFTSTLVFIILMLFKNPILNTNNQIGTFLWLVPVGVLFTGLFQVFSAWNTRQRFYKNVSGSKVVQSSTTTISQFSLKYISNSGLGLIIGSIIGFILSLLTLLIQSFRKNSIHVKSFSKKRIAKNFTKYKNFPKYQSWSVLINSLSQHLPVILLTLFYSPAIAGFYGLTHRALNTPARLIGGSVRQVFYERASKIYSEGKNIKKIFEKATLSLVKVTLIPYILLGIFSKFIFTFLFGSEWLISGIYAQYVIFFIFTITINPPSVMSIQILGMQKFHLKYEVLLAISRFTSIYIGFYFFNNHIVSIGLFAVIGMIFNIFLIIYVYGKIKNIPTIVS